MTQHGDHRLCDLSPRCTPTRPAPDRGGRRASARPRRPRAADRGSHPRTVGRSLIRLGHALAAEPEPTPCSRPDPDDGPGRLPPRLTESHPS